MRIAEHHHTSIANQVMNSVVHSATSRTVSAAMHSIRSTELPASVQRCA